MKWVTGMARATPKRNRGNTCGGFWVPVIPLMRKFVVSTIMLASLSRRTRAAKPIPKPYMRMKNGRNQGSTAAKFPGSDILNTILNISIRRISSYTSLRREKRDSARM